MNPDELFARLVIGLYKYFEGDASYPYPREMQHGLNVLSAVMLENYPKTLSGILYLFSLPVQEWWPFEMPSEFDLSSPLIDDDELSFQAQDYLDMLQRHDSIPQDISGDGLQRFFDNKKFTDIMDFLNEAAYSDPHGSETEYMILRRFIIQNPITTIVDIESVFGACSYITSDQVKALYIEAAEISTAMSFKNADGHTRLWECIHCGPLYLRRGEPGSIKKTSCGDHCPRYLEGGWVEHGVRGRLVVREGLHLRTQIPGVAEINLFDAICDLQMKHPKQMPTPPQLWPELDRYDLKIQFEDSVWAIDVKDHAKPGQLAKKLQYLPGEGNLRWDQAFYVYPAFRDQQKPDYGDILRKEVQTRLPGIQVMSDEAFLRKVQSKLKILKRESR